MKLYEIDKALEAALEAAFDPDTGEVLDDEAMQTVEELELAREDKLEGIALWIKDLDAEATAIREEEKKLAARRKAIENKEERVKGFLKYALAGEKFKTARVAVSYRTSEAVEIAEDVNAYDLITIDQNFVKLPAPEINKIALKAALKEGAEIEGVQLVKRTSIQIK